MTAILPQREITPLETGLHGCPQRIRTQNCNLELSHAHIRDEKSGDSPGGQIPDRVLQNGGIESHVVDPASIATSRRRRRAKTDRIDGEALLRALLAYKRGEPREIGRAHV